MTLFYALIACTLSVLVYSIYAPIPQLSPFNKWYEDGRKAGSKFFYKWLITGQAAVFWLLAYLSFSFPFGYHFALLLIPTLAGFVVYVALTLHPENGTAHGSAKFQSEADLSRWAASSKCNGVLLGKDPQTQKPLKYLGDAHLLTVAPTRSGKGVSAIIPNLLTYEGSALVVDPKGENARITARTRAQKGDVYVLDPFGVTGLSTASYNPIGRITTDNEDALDDAASLADALVVRSKDGDNHWDDEAASLLEGIILFVGLHEEPSRRHLGTVRELITASPDQLNQILEVMKDCGGLVERTANRFLSKSDREASSVLSTAQRHTKFLDSDRMTKVLGSAAGMSFAELKQKTGTTIFLCIPPDRLDTYGRWLRLMVNEALVDMAVTSEKPKYPVLFLLDEFAALGPLQSVKRAMGLMAGYGIILWPFLQDLSQLKALYAEAAQTFFANAGAVQWFGLNDIETAKQLSETIGKTTIGGLASSTHGRSLMTPDELMKIPSSSQIVMLQGKDPAVLSKIEYYSDTDFSGLWDRDPNR